MADIPLPIAENQPERQFKEIKNLVGFDYSSAIADIPDNKCRLLTNYISKIGRRIVKIPGWTTVTLSTSLPSNIVRMYVVYVGAATGVAAVPYLIMFLANGSCYKHNLSTATTASLWTTSTFTNPRLVQWKQERIVVCDPSAGIKDWNGTTTTNTSTTKGNFITVWEGRLFLLRTDTNALAWTAPDTYNDFNVGNGAGVVELTDPNIRGNVTGFAATSGILYIFAENAVETASNLRMTGSTTVFDLKPLFGNRGCKYPDSIAVYENIVYFMDEKGIWEVTGFASRRISEPDVDGLLPYLNTSSFSPVGFIGTMYNIDFYGLLVKITPKGATTAEKWILCFYNDGWFIVKYGQDSVFITSGVEISGTVYNFSGDTTNVRNYFNPTSSQAITSVIESKAYDEGNDFLDKMVNRFGLNLSEVDGELTFYCAIIAGDTRYDFTLGVDYDGNINWLNGSGDAVQWTGTGAADVFFVVGSDALEVKTGVYGRGETFQFTIEETSAKRYAIDSIKSEYFVRSRW